MTPVSDYLDGIRLELERLAPLALTPRTAAWSLETVYLGGGTPSRLGAEGIRRLIELITQRGSLAPGAEVTLEANPEDVTAESVEAWMAAGISRISLGAQSFDDGVLGWMHRTHDARQIHEAVRLARAVGIRNLSLDLIFALPREIERSWSRDLETALALEPEHISLYGLTIEPATPLARWIAAGSVSPAADERYAEEFLLAHELMTAEGFTHYEVSNFAQPGRESRHNSAYWSGASYLGIGPAAHSHEADRRRWNVKPYAEWLRILREGGSVVEGEESLDVESAMTERAYLGLRTRDGYRIGASDRIAAEGWARAGWAVIEGDLVRLNAEGWLRLDSLSTGLTGS